MKRNESAQFTKRHWLDACAAVERERTVAVAEEFRPGRGLARVRRALRALKTGPLTEGVFAALVQEVVDHKPWSALEHHLLEPLFDALRVLARLSLSPRPLGNTIGDGDWAVRSGDVSVRGDLEVRGALLVTGSLRVSGSIDALGADWSSGIVVVLGDVHAARMHALGPCAIGGTLCLRQGLSTAYYHDTSSGLVARRLEAPVWLDRGDTTGRVQARRTVEHALRFQRWLPKRLPDYFEGEMMKVKWRDLDAAFFRKALRAAEAERQK